MGSKKQIAKAALTVTRWVGSPLSLFIHTIFFAGIFYTGFSGILPADYVFAITTNILSIEAIYLAILIQMTINYQAQALEEVQEDVEEIQEDVGEIQKDVDEIQEDVEDISEDVDELQEGVEEITEDDDADAARRAHQKHTLEDIQSTLRRLLEDVEKFKK